MLRIIMTGGGTAGHINPALAIAAKMRREDPDCEILFVGAKGRMETELVPAAGYKIETIDVRGFQRHITVKNIGRDFAAAYHAVTAGLEAGRIIKEFGPDIAIGTGGYVCGPVLRKAHKMGVPIAVHESNAYPGVTVKMLAGYADAVMIPEESARKYLPADARVTVTGNPLRADFLKYDGQTARKELGLDSRPLILSMGGSLGAERINAVMADIIIKSYRDKGFQHIHATGKRGYAAMAEKLRGNGVPLDGDGIRVRNYITDMPRCMAAADVVITRSGAMTLSELPAMGKPGILIPSPNVAENHQYYNAMALVNKGAALCIEEKDLSDLTVWRALEQMMAPGVRGKMGAAAKSLAILDADNRIYQVVMGVLDI